MASFQTKQTKNYFDSNSMRSIPEQEIKPVVPKKIPKTIRKDTFGFKVLDLESKLLPKIGILSAKKKLGQITLEAKQRVAKEIGIKKYYTTEEGKKIMKIIASVLNKHGFTYEFQEYLTDCLNSGHCDCDTNSAIYLTIGNELNLPLYAVSVPDHVFVRWDTDGKHDLLNPNAPGNKEDFNWETNSAKISTDKYYIKIFTRPSIESIKKGVYLSSLSHKKAIAIYLSNVDWSDKHAIKYLKKAIELDPKYTLAYYTLGRAYYYNGEYDKAIQSYKKAIELDPNYHGPLVHCRLGFTYYKKGEYNKAVEAYEKAIKLDPNYSSLVHYRLGLIYYKKGEYNKAIEAYKKAIKLIPEDAEAYGNLGISYYALGEYDKAIEAYKKAIKLDLKSPFTYEPSLAYYGLGNVYYKKGEYDKAIEAYERYIKLEPNNSDGYTNLIMAIKKTGRKKETAKWQKKLNALKK